MTDDRRSTAVLLTAKLACCGLLLLALTGSLASWLAWAAGEGRIYLALAVFGLVVIVALRVLRRRRLARPLDPATFRPVTPTGTPSVAPSPPERGE